MATGRTISGKAVFLGLRAMALVIAGLVVHALMSRAPDAHDPVFLTGFAGIGVLLWWAGGRLTRPATPYAYPQGEVVPLETLQRVFPNFDVKEGELLKRNGKIFRVNSTGLQVDIEPWSFDPNSGEFFPRTKDVSGYPMMRVEPFSKRLATFNKKKNMGASWIAGGIGACLVATVLLVPLAVALYGNGYTGVAVGLAAFVALMIVASVVNLWKYIRSIDPANLLGPEPFKRLSGDFGAEIPAADTKKKEVPASEYKIEL
jgi:hypothetical protein